MQLLGGKRINDNELGDVRKTVSYAIKGLLKER